MEMEKALYASVTRYLHQSGGMDRLRSALVARAALSPVPKILKVPVFVNLMEAREVDECLAEMVMTDPLQAQQLFHNVLHVAALSTMSTLRPCITSGDDHCPPAPTTALPILNDHVSLYPQEEKDKAGKDEEIESVDFDLSLQCLSPEGSPGSSLADETETLTAAQIYAPLRVSGIPWVKEWMVSSVRDLPLHLKEPILGLLAGRILAVSLPQSYTVWARYVCSNPGCAGTLKDIHVRVFSVGHGEADTVYHDRLCRVCGFSLEEDPSSRELGEKVQVVLVPAECSSLTKPQAEYARFQTLTLVLRDEMLQGVEPGQGLEATVMMVPRAFPALPTLEALVVHPPRPLRPHFTLPSFFRHLVEDRKSSPWSLVVTLAYMFASTVTPAGTFHTFKLALLLSLASCSSSKAGLAVLGVGSNTTLLLRLLRYGGRYAPCKVDHSPLDSVCGVCVKDPDGEVWVQGGSLLMAHGGACVLGDFSTFRKDVRQSVCRALECGVVHVQSPSHLRHKTPPVKYPLRAAAWACYDPAHGRRRTSTEHDDTFLHVPLGDLTKSITDIFGLVIYCETPDGECEREAEEVITLQTLLDSTNPEELTQPLLPPDQLRQFLCIARSLDVEFSPEAEKLIRGYYVATRRLRGDCVQGASVPITAIDTLAKVASCHARLALRKTVESWDAVVAVMLSEEALAAHSGYSLLQVKPTPHLPTHCDLHSILGRKNDERMLHFQRQLEDYILTHTGDISSDL
ncbi:minichromosome maintenance domain-containing protein 2-like [Penaeus chinensis]|uniref:minichromosome maintenance domain-containing protein 2-like n=1 Tax=Penaeus chinensis TaxID=139456 RepID=UPI001FB83778|nr:minichromosome maintenance domain-containing protein 2-like [Penaeus chinensis]